MDGDRGAIPRHHPTLCAYLPCLNRLVLVDWAALRWSRGEGFGLENVHVEADNEVRLSRFVTRLAQKPSYD